VSPPPVVQPLPEKKIITRHREHYAAVVEPRDQGWSKAAIARKLQLHPATVRKFAQARSIDDLLAKTEQRAKVVDDHVEYLHERWRQGERNATQLCREIIARGYTGGELAVQRYLRRFRHGRGTTPQPGPRPPTVREVTRRIMTHPDRIDPRDATAPRKIRNRETGLNRLTAHVRDFAAIMTGRQGHRLEEWITSIDNDTLPTLAVRVWPVCPWARLRRSDVSGGSVGRSWGR
jgi:transposase